MPTLRERLRAKQEERRLRSFKIGVSEDDLRAIAKRGYEGVLSIDPDQRGQALKPVHHGHARRTMIGQSVEVAGAAS